MAKNINTFNIPEYQTYSNEMEYVSPATISKETIQRIKSRNIKLGKASLFSI